ncbi:hypothetical protein LT679_15275 [Mucilaginibacter roseus]|uniref:Uncharacterized protein n=1 Tax=Mucilaginibacter roseus TaxID=1528868 RepID=A0ABS8U7R5_9SPHI|nr:hypothetical protein [Mucilaginibacter roseus]MCD8741974.1 hypothetical protein [Mucilaginibacter roseus]
MMKRGISISTELWIYLSGYPMSLRESGGSERKSGKPDFSARPAGPRRFLVYRWYTLPPALCNRKEISIPVGIPYDEKCVNDGDY